MQAAAPLQPRHVQATAGGASRTEKAAAAAAAHRSGAGFALAAAPTAAPQDGGNNSSSSSSITVGVRVRPGATGGQDVFTSRKVVVGASEDGTPQLVATPDATEGGGGGAGRALGRITPADFVFGSDVGQEEVYASAVRRLVASVADGVNVSVIAYGQTGSGKTYTMVGDPATEHTRGIIPRALNDLFARLGGLAASEGWAWEVHASFLEVYHERIYDLLLAPGDAAAPGMRDSKDMRDRDRLAAGGPGLRTPLEMSVGGGTGGSGGGGGGAAGGEGGVTVKGLTRLLVARPEDAMAALAAGFASRRTGSTAMNAVSSRSHAVVTLYVTGTRPVGGGEGGAGGGAENALSSTAAAAASASRLLLRRSAVLDIVDLAGSERVRSTGAEGTTLAEAGSINKSLMTLKQVVQKLFERQQSVGGGGGGGGTGAHVPWRDSVLTQLLKRSLGGNARTAIIATLSPALEHWPESQSTLLFAQQVRTIRTVYAQNDTLLGAGGSALGGGGGGGAVAAAERSRAMALSRELAAARAENDALRQALGLPTQGGSAAAAAAARGKPVGGMQAAGGAACDAGAPTTDQPADDDLCDRLTAAASAAAEAGREVAAAADALAGPAQQLAALAAVGKKEADAETAASAAAGGDSGFLAATATAVVATTGGLGERLAALAADALAARREAVASGGYAVMLAAAEAQLALVAPVATAYFGGGDVRGLLGAGAGAGTAAKRPRLAPGAFLAAAEPLLLQGSPLPDEPPAGAAGRMTGVKRGRRGDPAAGAVAALPASPATRVPPTPMYRNSPAVRVATGQLPLSALSAADMLVPSGGGVGTQQPSARDTAAAAAAAAAAVAQAAQQARAATAAGYDGTLAAVRGALSSAEAHCDAVDARAAAVATALAGLLEGVRAAGGAAARAAALLQGGRGGGDAEPADATAALLLEAASCLSIDRAARWAAVSALAAAAARITELAAEADGAKEAAAAAIQERDRLAGLVDELRRVGLAARADGVTARREAAGLAARLAALGGGGGGGAAAAAAAADWAGTLGGVDADTPAEDFAPADDGVTGGSAYAGNGSGAETGGAREWQENAADAASGSDNQPSAAEPPADGTAAFTSTTTLTAPRAPPRAPVMDPVFQRAFERRPPAGRPVAAAAGGDTAGGEEDVSGGGGETRTRPRSSSVASMASVSSAFGGTSAEGATGAAPRASLEPCGGAFAAGGMAATAPPSPPAAAPKPPPLPGNSSFKALFKRGK